MPKKNTLKPAVKAPAPKVAVKLSAPKARRKIARARKNPDLFANRVRRQTPRHPRKPFVNSMQIFWSTGMLGGIMFVTAALWSAWRTPTPAPDPATAQLALPVDRTPAAADPPRPASPQPARFEDPSIHPSQALAQAFDDAAKIAPEQRVSWWSAWLARAPHASEDLASLGRGPAIADPAPLIPPHFNCTTFVETVAALARSEHPQLFFQRLIEIRYHGAKPDYLSRNHFPETDWIPNNVQAGNLRDLTMSLAQASGIKLKTLEKTIDRAKWLGEQKRRSAEVARALESAAEAEKEWSHSEHVKLAYIPKSALGTVIDRVPDGAVVNFVRQNSANRPVLISHQGFIVKEKGVVWLRHATPGGHLRTVVLSDYLRRNAGFIGVALDQINDKIQGIN